MSAALILTLPFASQHLVNQETRAALETTTALAAAIAGGVSAMFIGGRRRLRDQLLAAGLVTAACGLVASSFGIFPTFASGGSQPAADVLLATNLALGVGFLLASVFGDRPAHPGRRGALVIAVGFALGVLLIGELLSALMPAGPGNGTVLHTPVLMLRLLTAAAFGLAGVRFVGGGRTAVNELLAGASILFAIEQLAALAIPSFRDWVTIRDPLRVIAWMLVLVAAGVEVRARQQELNRAALQSERERIARDIHDGIVQDLAAIAIHGASLGERLGEQHPMIVAARSAIAASRQTINDLSASSARSTADALRTVGEELGAKLDLDVRVCASAGGRELAGAHREHAVRIAREAIVNAA
ncbi:MAG TPA: histidine kinase, partial [Solirubrobacteraceae bacterium]|nr:histidine kinase [Solirubrobacteraceae bacterium]